MEYQPRYQAFLHLGGGTNREFIIFISRMKQKYFEKYSFSKEDCIINHERFTDFVFETVDKCIATGVTIEEFIK